MFEQVDATVSSMIDFPRFDLQYFGTEYHSALALRLAIVAKPQIKMCIRDRAMKG